MVLPSLLGQMIRKLTVHQGRSGKAGVRTGLIQGDRIKGRKHAEVRQDRRVIFPMAVTIGRHVDNEVHMESRPTMNDGQDIFRHLTVKQLVGIPLHGFNGIKGTRPDTAAAASASRLIDVGLALS